MQHPRQNGGHRGQSKVELTFLAFHPDLTLTFRLCISLHHSLLWSGRTEATKVCSCQLSTESMLCRVQKTPSLVRCSPIKNREVPLFQNMYLQKSSEPLLYSTSLQCNTE